MKDEPFPDFLQITPIRRKKVRSQKYLEFCNLECFCAHLLLVLNKANSKNQPNLGLFCKIFCAASCLSLASSGFDCQVQPIIKKTMFETKTAFFILGFHPFVIDFASPWLQKHTLMNGVQQIDTNIKIQSRFPGAVPRLRVCDVCFFFNDAMFSNS